MGEEGAPVGEGAGGGGGGTQTSGQVASGSFEGSILRSLGLCGVRFMVMPEIPSLAWGSRGHQLKEEGD